MKVSMQSSVSVAANSTDDNVLAGEQFVRSPTNSTGTLWQTGSAIGLQASLNVGGFQVMNDVTAGAANRVPVTDEDMILDQWKAKNGNLIQLQVANTTGGALTYQYRVILDDNPALYAAT